MREAAEPEAAIPTHFSGIIAGGLEGRYLAAIARPGVGCGRSWNS
jgi:hypothetical protein